MLVGALDDGVARDDRVALEARVPEAQRRRVAVAARAVHVAVGEAGGRAGHRHEGHRVRMHLTLVDVAFAGQPRLFVDPDRTLGDDPVEVVVAQVHAAQTAPVGIATLVDAEAPRVGTAVAELGALLVAQAVAFLPIG